MRRYHTLLRDALWERSLYRDQTTSEIIPRALLLVQKTNLSLSHSKYVFVLSKSDPVVILYLASLFASPPSFSGFSLFITSPVA
jgi:hypothetical protein